MRQMYVKLSGQVLVGRDFTLDKWYPVTIVHDGLVEYIVDNDGESYMLDLHRLNRNPAWDVRK